MSRSKPIIGLVGGIGSGKSFVAGVFRNQGCVVVDSDAQVSKAYQSRAVLDALKGRWGDEILHADGSVNRTAIARKIFIDPGDRRWLEALLHPLVNEAREAMMLAHSGESQVKAFVWDTPLLIEAGMADRCDAIVFIDAPADVRLERVRKTRGWNEAQLQQRQKLQHPLDNKRAIADYVIENTADVGAVRNQVRDVLSRILKVF